jgi:energy-coupling factor transporter ATP-binding protein EcfA2
MAFFAERQRLAVRLQQVVESVGLQSVPFDISPSLLSGGQQRRLALALQLVRQPSVLLLDEPLAGLDWRARAEVVQLLARLKHQCSLLVVSHDLREIAPLVDCAFRMQGGGRLEQVDWAEERGRAMAALGMQHGV